MHFVLRSGLFGKAVERRLPEIDLQSGAFDPERSEPGLIQTKAAIAPHHLIFRPLLAAVLQQFEASGRPLVKQSRLIKNKT
jgi:hypothetical protein